MWQSGHIVDLGTLPGLNDSVALAINASGQVVGSSGSHAVMWQNGDITDLGTLPGYPSSVANGINDQGQVVGAVYNNSDQSQYATHAVLWQNGQITDLGILSRAGWNITAAHAINERGQMVGHAAGGGVASPVIWDAGQIRELAINFPGSAQATAINEEGQVVGGISPESGQYGVAALWQPGSIDMEDLPNLPVPSPYESRGFAYGINNLGQIVGYSMTGQGPNAHAVLWQPVATGAPPITVATFAPPPDANGTNHGDVTVQITTTASPGGAPVQSITYSATGAQSIASTTVAGSTTTVTISAEGSTSFTYFATDQAGDQEQPKTHIININKTPPPFQFTSESAVYNPATRQVEFTVTFNQPPDFLTTDSAGRQKNSFQYFIVGDPAKPYPARYDTIIRGEEIHLTTDKIPIRNVTPDGWGTVRGEVPYSVVGNTLTFSTPLSLISDHSVDGHFDYRLEIYVFGGETNYVDNHSVASGATAPATTASLTPPPNAAGWERGNVTATLTATAASGGVVRSITYSATGAQTIASTTVQGSTAQVTISAEGTITLSYFATDQAGNQEQPNTLSVRIDRTPPVTTATPNPAPNSAGWNNANVTVTLTATDSLSGVDHTEYSLDDAGWTAYTGPIAVTTDGVHEVQYRSIDKAGNVEAAPQLAVKIDKTPPEAVVQFDPTTDSLLVFGKDSGSGMPAGPIAPSSSISTSWSRDGAVDNGMPDANTTAELRTYKLTDLAGNATTLVIKVQVLGQHGDRLKARLVSIQYGSPPPVTFASNTEEFHLVLATDGSLSRLDQQVRVGSGHDQQAVDALFDASQAHTDIRVKSPPPPSVVQKPGLDLLQVATLKGQLSILY